MIEYSWLKLTLQPFLLTIIVIFTLKPFALKVGLTDIPSKRKHHNGRIPLIGGIAIFFSVTTMLFLHNQLTPFFLAFLLASFFLVFVGVIDDYKNLNIIPRFCVQILAALIMIYLGHTEIKSLGNLLGFGELQLGWFAKPFTIFAVVGGINAFNMVDGMDGLAGSIALFIFALLAVICNTIAFVNISFLCLLYISSIAGFLIYNLRIFGRSATVFLGDTGSTLFGFSICWFVIAASQGENKVIEPATVLWIIALPIMDTVGIMIRRIRNKRSPFAPDREHFHHILTLAGFSVNDTLIIMLLSSVFMAMIGIYGEFVLHVDNYLMFYLFLSAFVLYYWGMCHAWKVMKITRKLTPHKNTRQ